LQPQDEPPFDEVPPPFDDDVPPEMDAPAEERVPDYGADAEVSASQVSAGQPSSAGQQDGRRSGQRNVAVPSGQHSQQNPGQPNGQPNGQQNSGQPNGQQRSGEQSPAPAQRQHPNASAPRGTTRNPSRAPSFAEKQRYGEAVVREILGATFIEEQPYTAAPRTRNDH
jgi:DNA polymerase-3 subunit gamma/tau